MSLYPSPSDVRIVNSTDHYEYIFGSYCNTTSSIIGEKGQESIRHSIDDKPSFIVVSERGQKKYCWHSCGLLHRSESLGPAVSVHDEHGNMFFERYYQLGKLHRKHGPAEINLERGNYVWALHDRQFETFDHWLSFTSIPEEEKCMLKLKYG